MARQFFIPGGPDINSPQDGREYFLPGYGDFNDEAAAAAVNVGHRIIGGGWGGRVISIPHEYTRSA